MVVGHPTVVFPPVVLTLSKTVTDEDRALLEKLMPQDMWMYEYAQRLFEARWKLYKTGKYEEPDLPDLQWRARENKDKLR